jgi:hypothetical protein
VITERDRPYAPVFRAEARSVALRATPFSGAYPFGMLDRPFVHKRVHALLQLRLFFRRLRPGRRPSPQQSVEIIKKIEPHTTGFMTARTVTIACTIW